MRCGVLDAGTGVQGLDLRPTFNVLMVYEDFETGKRAKETYDFLVSHLDCTCEFMSRVWKFEVLGIPELVELAIEDAVAADLVIISSHGGKALPPQVADWMDRWMAVGTHNTMALVALFECSPEEASGVREQLREAANRKGIKFFSQTEKWALAPTASDPFFSAEQDVGKTDATPRRLTETAPQEAKTALWGSSGTSRPIWPKN